MGPGPGICSYMDTPSRRQARLVSVPVVCFCFCVWTLTSVVLQALVDLWTTQMPKATHRNHLRRSVVVRPSAAQVRDTLSFRVAP